MVMTFKGWYVYEPGDSVYSLARSKRGIVRAISTLDVANRTQKVFVQFQGSRETEEVDTSTLELRYRMDNSAFAGLKPKDTEQERSRS